MLGRYDRAMRARGPVGRLTLLQQAIAAIRRNNGALFYVPANFAGAWTGSAGTDPVDAVADVIGRMTDRTGGSAVATQATTANKPTVQTNSQGRYVMRFDGSNDFFTIGPSTFAAGTLPSACDLVISLTRKGSGQMLLVHDANASGTRFIGVMQPGSGLSAVNESGAAWSVFVNGVQVGAANSVTRAQLDAAAPVGVPVVIEFRDLNMSTWTNLQIGNYTSFVINADVTAIAFGASSASDRAIIRKWIGSLQGQTL